MNHLQPVQTSDLSSTKLSPSEASLLARAEKSLGGELRTVSQNGLCYAADDMRRVIAVIDADATPAAPDEISALVSALIGKCRANAMTGGPITKNDFAVYASGIREAFELFPASVGLQAIHGGTGVPSKSNFWPNPHVVVQFCSAIMQRRQTAKVMARRYIAESERRVAAASVPELTSEERARRLEILDMLKNDLSATKVIEPVAPPPAAPVSNENRKRAMAELAARAALRTPDEIAELQKIRSNFAGAHA